MTTTADYFNQSSLAFAAYADLSRAASPYSLALQAADMSETQADHFLHDWRVVDQYTDPSSGVSATIFPETAGGPKYLSIRRTEPNALDLTTDGLLALGLPASLNPQFAALKTQIDLWRSDPTKLGDQIFSVTGHSLGGYLAAAVKEYYGAQVSDAYLVTQAELALASYKSDSTPK